MTSAALSDTAAAVVKARLPVIGIYRVLVCRPNHRLGNNLLLTPLITEIERLFKGAEIDIVSEGTVANAVFSTTYCVRNIYCLPTRGFKHPLAFLSLLARIRKTRYDLIIDPCVGSGFSRILTRLLHGRCKLGFVGSGGSSAKHSGLTHGAAVDVAGRHMAQRPINLLHWSLYGRAGTCRSGAPSQVFPPLDIRLTDDERARGRRHLAELLSRSGQTDYAPVIGIFANATGAKRYPQSWWNELIGVLKSRVPLCPIVEFIPMHGQSLLGSQWPAYYSSEIRRMAAVMAATDFMISADCGVMHLAVASGTPTVGLFCTTDDEVYAPYGQASCALSTRQLSASAVAEQIAALFHRQRVSPAHNASQRARVEIQ